MLDEVFARGFELCCSEVRLMCHTVNLEIQAHHVELHNTDFNSDYQIEQLVDESTAGADT